MLVVMDIGRYAGQVLDLSFEAARALLLAGHARRPEYDARYQAPEVEPAPAADDKKVADIVRLTEYVAAAQQKAKAPKRKG